MKGKGLAAVMLAAWISLLSNVLLTAIKLVVGWLFHSQVLLADGVHNAGDVIASLAALGAASVAKKPADEDHPYGHGKAEIIGSAAVAIVLFLAAFFIGYHSVLSLFHPAAAASWIALIAAVLSLVWKQGLYVYCMRISRQTRSKSLQATAYDHLADVYASLAAVIGISAALIGDHWGISFLRYGDAVAGLIVAYFVVKLAWDMAREATDILMEKNVSPELLEAYTTCVKGIAEVQRIDRIRAREHGYYIIVDVRVGISGTLTVQEGHDISRKIKRTLMDQYDDIEEVLVHLNPWYEEDEKR